MAKLTRDEKYDLYESSVQNPEADVAFISKEFKAAKGRQAISLREDFCGTGAMACHWVKTDPSRKAFGIDLDVEPISYGLDHHYLTMPESAQKRMQYIKGNVLSRYDFKTDIVVAFNFSYFLFKERKTLVQYFKSVNDHLNADGMFFIDLFGGTETRKELVESNKFKSHKYIWDCDSYNPLTAECKYYIHFEKKGQRFEKVFQYDWRMWDAKELQDVLTDAGFKNVQTYWEGVDKDGSGNGKFKKSFKAENCESWVTYISASK